MKKLLLILVASFILVSCDGGGDGGGGDSSSDFDMWDYVVSKTTITKNFDKYDTDSNYNPIGGPYLNAGQLKETVLSSDTVKYEEIENGIVVGTQQFTVTNSF